MAAPSPQQAGRWGHRGEAGSLRRRILLLAAVWIAGLLLVGGLALDRIVTDTIIRNFDEQLSDPIPAMLAAAEVDAFGEVRFNRPPVAPQFNEPYSGFYWQVSAKDRPPFRSRSLWDRELPVDFRKSCVDPCISRSSVFRNEPLRLVERDGIIPGSSAIWRFQVAESTVQLDEQVREVRGTLVMSLGVLGAGLMLLALIQASIGLMPLARLSHVLSAIRSGGESRVPTENVPPEVAPLVHGDAPDEYYRCATHDCDGDAASGHCAVVAGIVRAAYPVIIRAAVEASPAPRGNGLPVRSSPRVSVKMGDTTMSTDWTAWLGPAADELTGEQRDRLDDEAAEIIERIGDDPDDQDDRDAALSAVVQYLLGETTIDQAGRERAATLAAARHASIAAQTIARLAGSTRTVRPFSRA